MPQIESFVLYIIVALLFLILLFLVYLTMRIRKKFRREPDWNLVYPELGGMYDADDSSLSVSNRSQDLDLMLEDPKFEKPSNKPPREHYKEKLENSVIEDKVGDEVMCSAYAPEAVCRDEEFIVAAFAHLPEQKEEVAEMARMIDDEIVKRAEKFLPLKVEQGNKIGFLLRVDGCSVDDPYQEFAWFGRTDSVEFGVEVPKDFAKRAAVAKIDISVNSIPVGNIKFRIKLDHIENINYSQQADTRAEKYKRAFISYASPDRAEVLRRTQMLSATGVTFFQDIMNIKPGEQWEQKLFEEIDNCDVFYLFWSKSASDSQWVKQEWEYALKIRGQKSLPEIIPVPIEGPPCIDPPDQLRHLHFNDGFLFFLSNS